MDLHKLVACSRPGSPDECRIGRRLGRSAAPAAYCPAQKLFRLLGGASAPHVNAGPHLRLPFRAGADGEAPDSPVFLFCNNVAHNPQRSIKKTPKPEIQ